MSLGSAELLTTFLFKMPRLSQPSVSPLSHIITTISTPGRRSAQNGKATKKIQGLISGRALKASRMGKRQRFAEGFH